MLTHAPVRRLAAAFVAAVVTIVTPADAMPARHAVRNDYANERFENALSAGFRAFYTRDFSSASAAFDGALAVVPDNTLALAFRDATAANEPGDLDRLVNREEDAVARSPRDYLAHVRLGFAYLFLSQRGRVRDGDARDELNAAVALVPHAPAAHVGLGILRFGERSANRAKAEFLAALASDPVNVLAREYLGEIYQIDLRDPQRGLAYMIEIPDLVPAYPDIDFHIASLLYDLKQSDAAIRYATQGLELDIGHVGEAGQHGYTLLARIYIDEHRLDDARRVLRAAISSQSDAAYAQTLLDRIAKGDYDPHKDDHDSKF